LLSRFVLLLFTSLSRITDSVSPRYTGRPLGLVDSSRPWTRWLVRRSLYGVRSFYFSDIRSVSFLSCLSYYYYHPSPLRVFLTPTRLLTSLYIALCNKHCSCVFLTCMRLSRSLIPKVKLDAGSCCSDAKCLTLSHFLFSLSLSHGSTQ